MQYSLFHRITTAFILYSLKAEKDSRGNKMFSLVCVMFLFDYAMQNKPHVQHGRNFMAWNKNRFFL